jgi:hypothetical protein
MLCTGAEADNIDATLPITRRDARTSRWTLTELSERHHPRVLVQLPQQLAEVRLREHGRADRWHRERPPDTRAVRGRCVRLQRTSRECLP